MLAAHDLQLSNLLGCFHPISGTFLKPLILYQRDDCHLCDLALTVLADAAVPDFESVFIDGDAALEARYGCRVPVLSIGTRELDWPFTAEDVSACLRQAACK